MDKDKSLYLQALRYVRGELHALREDARHAAAYDASKGLYTSQSFDSAQVKIFTQLIQLLDELEADTLKELG